MGDSMGDSMGEFVRHFQPIFCSFSAHQDNPQSVRLSTTEILLIAIGTGLLVTTIVGLGVLAVCKWRRKQGTVGNRAGKANGHDRIMNGGGGLRQPLFGGGGLRQPLFGGGGGGSKKYIRPEIVITEATSDDRRSSGVNSVFEVSSH